MNKMNKWKAIAGSVLLTGALATPGFALAFEGGDHGSKHGTKHGSMHHKHRMFERMAEKLELTEGQKAQLNANREANRTAHKEQRSQERALRKQLREAIDNGADQSTLDSLGAELGRAQVARMQAMHQRHQQFEAILTDDQKAKLEQMKADRAARHEKRGKRWSKDGE